MLLKGNHVIVENGLLHPPTCQTVLTVMVETTKYTTPLLANHSKGSWQDSMLRIQTVLHNEIQQ